MLKHLLLGLALCLTLIPMQASAQGSGAMPLPDITIYHLEGRRSERIVWLMEELGFPYELVYTRGDLGASMAAIRALGHEMPMAPTVVYGDQIIVESGAIIEMILDRHAPDKLKPWRVLLISACLRKPDPVV